MNHHPFNHENLKHIETSFGLRPGTADLTQHTVAAFQASPNMATAARLMESDVTAEAVIDVSAIFLMTMISPLKFAPASWENAWREVKDAIPALVADEHLTPDDPQIVAYQHRIDMIDAAVPALKTDDNPRIAVQTVRILVDDMMTTVALHPRVLRAWKVAMVSYFLLEDHIEAMHKYALPPQNRRTHEDQKSSSITASTTPTLKEFPMDSITIDRTRLASIWIEITGRCQLACTHCYADSGPGQDHGTMTFDDWKTVIDDARAIGCKLVQIIGGEPILHPEFSKIVNHVITSGMDVEIATNLVHVTDQMWELFTDRCNLSLAVSYYGADSDDHATVTGTTGSHARTRTNLIKAIGLDIPVRGNVIHVNDTQNIDAAVDDSA